MTAAVDGRRRCRCSGGSCVCTRNGRPVPAPARLPAVVAAAGRTRPAGGPARRPYQDADAAELRRRGYFEFVEAAGLPYGARFDEAAAALVDAHVRLHQAGRYDDAELMIRAVRAHGAHVRRMRERSTLAELEVRVFGAAGALVREVARRQRAQHAWRQAQVDVIHDRIHGEGSAAARRLYDRVHGDGALRRREQERRRRGELVARWMPAAVDAAVREIETRAFGAPVATRRWRWRVENPGRPLPVSMKMPIGGGRYV